MTDQAAAQVLPEDESTPKAAASTTAQAIAMVAELTPEEALALEQEGLESATAAAMPEGMKPMPIDPPEGKVQTFPASKPSSEGVPGWVVLPPNFTFPAGRVVAFLMFRAEWTDTPEKGDRQCIVWNLTSNDVKQALKRTQGESTLVLTELTKQMVRAYDGKAADWDKNGVRLNVFWEELGERCRQMIQNYYVKTHSLTDKETDDFFSNCIALRTVA